MGPAEWMLLLTLSLLWEEYRAIHPDDGYGYSRYCELYRCWEGRLTPVMRQHHVAGDKLFVDYAGDTLDVVDPKTGEVREAQLFVAVLGASNYTFAEATWTQTLPDWIGSHVRAFAFLGGVPGQIVSDNLKSGVTKACFYEPAVNRTYADLAAHYDTAVIPARPYKPRDKAKVEVGVQVAQRWVAARLRNRRFFSLAELNAAIGDLLAGINRKVTRHLGASRRDLFEQLDRPALKPLPAAPYQYAEWIERKVGLDYHVETGRHYYSVPHQLLKKTLWARLTAKTVEIFHEGQRVASHVRSSANRRHTTVPEHMPASHRRYAGWTPAEIKRQATRIGPNTATLVGVILRERTHPEQGFRSCQIGRASCRERV
jgi:transposase